MKVGAGSRAGVAHRGWVNDDGKLRFGQYEGRDLGDVARDDPGYLEWIIESAEIRPSDDEVAAIEACLRRPAR